MIYKILSILKNKYFIILTCFLIWIIFFDERSIITLISKQKELKKLQTSRNYYNHEININKKYIAELKTNPSFLEKLAREKYLFKRANEDIYLIEVTN